MAGYERSGYGAGADVGIPTIPGFGGGGSARTGPPQPSGGLLGGQGSGDGAAGGGGGFGGCVMSFGQLVVTNTTFTACRARGGRGTANVSTPRSVDGGAFGAAIFSYFSTTIVAFSTFAGNTVASGPRTVGVGATVSSIRGVLRVDSSVVWDTRDADSGSLVTDVYAGEAATDGASNVIGTVVDDNAGMEWVSTDPLLSPLSDHGGPTRTMALLPGSSAHNTGDAALAAVPFPAGAGGVDQRGSPRAGMVDIGAYEVQPCGADEAVIANVCTACPAGSTRAAGDDPLGPDAACEPNVCAANEYVSNHACAPCAAGSVRAAGDLATGADTECAPTPDGGLADGGTSRDGGGGGADSGGGIDGGIDGASDGGGGAADVGGVAADGGAGDVADGGGVGADGGGGGLSGGDGGGCSAVATPVESCALWLFAAIVMVGAHKRRRNARASRL